MAQLVGSNSLGLGKLIDGKNQFVHIMYSANVDGSNMTADIQADTKYIGIVTSNSETAPTNPSDYSWGRFVGTSGTSSYTWLRYSPNEDGSNMTANPTSETKYIGVAITADNNAPTDYTKYSWALIKGDDGRGISKTEVTYQKSTSGTVIPTGTWVTTIPTVNAGEYLWTRTLFTYTDNTTSSTYSVARSGVTGLGISRSDVDYQKSTSGTVAPTGAWTATIPTVAANEYLWTRTTLTYTNATTSVSYSVGKMGADGKDAQLLYLTASSQIQAFDKDDRPKTTQAITISAKLQNASGTATFVAIPYIGNVAQTAITLGGTGNDRTLLPSQWTNTQWTTIAITATLGSLTDTISVIKVKDGATGPKGDIGNQGIPGEKGEDGRTPYTHWAYAWSADGKDRFTTIYPNENLFPGSKATLTEVTWSGYEYDMTLIDLTKINYKQGDRIFYSYYADNTKGTALLTATMFFYGSSGALITTSTLRKNVEIGAKGYAESDLIIPANAVSMRVPKIRKNASGSGTASYSQNKLELLSKTIYTPSPSEDFENAYPKFAGTYIDYEPTDSEDPAKYTWQRILGDQGDKGDSATSYWITPSVNTIQISTTKVLNPTTVTFTGYSKTGTANAGLYAGRFNILTSVDGIVYSSKYSSSANQSAYTYTVPADVKFIKAKMYQAGGFTALVDEVTIPIIESAEGLEIGGRNYFSVKAWNTKPALTINGIPYMDINLEPNTQYTLSTNIPSRDTLRDVFFLKGTDTPSSLVNGVAKDLPRTLTTNADGIVKVAVRDYNFSSGYWIMLSKGNKSLDWQPAIEDDMLFTAYSNSADGTVDFTKKYPNKNLFMMKNFTYGQYITWTGDGLTPNSVRGASDYIPVEAGKRYSFSFGINCQFAVFLYKEYGDVKSDLRLNVAGTAWESPDGIGNASYVSSPTPEIPTGYKYMRVSVLRGSADFTYELLRSLKIKIEEGLEKTAYVISIQDDSGKSEMGYIGYSPIDSNNASDYVWTENPKAVSLYTAWSNDPNGKDMVRVYPNENLLLNSTNNFFNKIAFSQATGTKSITDNIAKINLSAITGSYLFYLSNFKTMYVFEKSVNYALSFDIKATKAFNATSSSINQATITKSNWTGTIGTEWQRIKITFNPQYATADATNLNFHFFIGTGNTDVLNNDIYIQNVKLEKVSSSTDEASPYTTPPSEDPVKAEMAYIGYSPKDSNDPADYVWSENPKAKGTFKRWANSPDGTVDFIAQYPNENLFTITRPEVKNPAATKAEFLNNPNWDMAPIFDSYGAGIPYTLSFDLKSAVAGAIQVYSQNGSGSKYNIGTTSIQATTEFQRFTVTFTPQLQTGTTQTQALLAFYGVYDSGRVPTVRNLKLELGSVATLDIPSVSEDLLATIPQYVGIGSKDTMNPADFVWNINPEYNQARTDLGLDSKVDDETFNDAQDHMNEVVDGKADAQELQDLKDMADNLQQSYEGFVSEGGKHEADLQALEARVEGLIFELDEQVAAFDFVKTHMRLGEEGFEIAEEGSTMKMLLSNNALSFIDGGKEVASFSNQKFIINQGAIVESLQVGSHKMSRLSDKVTVFQYAPKTTVTK